MNPISSSSSASSTGSTGSPLQTSALDTQTDRLTRKPVAKPAPQTDCAIEKSAKDFESILIGQWLQGAEKTFATVPGGTDEDQDPAKDQLQGIAMQSLATSLTASGGFGLAKLVAKGLHKANNAIQATGPPKEDPTPPSGHFPHKL